MMFEARLEKKRSGRPMQLVHSFCSIARRKSVQVAETKSLRLRVNILVSGNSS